MAPTAEDPAECVHLTNAINSRAILKALDNGPWMTQIAEPSSRRTSRACVRRRGGAARGHQQPDPAVIGGGQGSLQAASRDRRNLLRPQPRSRRQKFRTWLRGRENVHKRYLLHVAGHNLIVADAPTHRRRHPARGRGGRIWRYFRAAHAHRGHAGRTGGLANLARRFSPPHSSTGSESRKKPLNQRARYGLEVRQGRGLHGQGQRRPADVLTNSPPSTGSMYARPTPSRARSPRFVCAPTGPRAACRARRRWPWSSNYASVLRENGKNSMDRTSRRDHSRRQIRRWRTPGSRRRMISPYTTFDNSSRDVPCAPVMFTVPTDGGMFWSRW